VGVTVGFEVVGAEVPGLEVVGVELGAMVGLDVGV
jgi:hypothetical protein